MSDIEIAPGMMLFDDTLRHSASNGQITRGRLIEQEARVLQHYQHAGRPFFHFAGYHLTNDNPALFRFVRANFMEGGGQSFRARLGVVPFEGATTSEQGVTVTVDGSTDYETAYPTTLETTKYPEDLQALDLTEINSYSGTTDDYAFGPTDASSPYLYSGCFFEDALTTGNSDTTITPETFRSGGDILAVKTSASSTLDRLRSTFRDVWRFRRPTFGWSCEEPDALVDPGIAFEENQGEFRYLFDQTIGDDGGTAPSITGPGITLPLMNSAAGRRNQIRVYVRVYACMTEILDGDPGDAEIGIANRASNGTMASTFSALTNGVTISGTTPQWWPDTPFNPTTDPYFLGYAGSTPDRVLLGARSSADASVRIQAFQMFAFHVG